MATELTEADLRTLAAVADRIFPALEGPNAFWTSSAGHLEVADRAPATMELLSDPTALRDLRLLLAALGSRAGGLLLYGRPATFADLSPEEAEAALLRMATSPLEAVRRGFQALKRLTAFLALTVPGDRSVAWAGMGYPGPPDLAAVDPPALEVERLEGPAVWSCDAVVVGSGAGGATAAAVLAEAGLDVVVLEKGPYQTAADLTLEEGTAYRRLYLEGGLASTSDRAVGLLAGSCLGGGTVTNYTTSLPLPDGVREEWDRVAGWEGVFAGEAFSRSQGEVARRRDANREHAVPSRRDALLEAGLRRLGWHVDVQPRNVRECPQDDACGFCTMGCRRGAKRSALVTWLADAHRAGARLVADAEVEGVLLEHGRAVGVEARASGRSLTVRARVVVLAAGALVTPLLLRRSGVQLPAVGSYLRLHPVSAMWGRFPDPVDPWSGTIQTRYSEELADLDGEGYGVRFETAPVHPAFPGIFFGWEGGRRFKETLAAYPHWSVVGVLLRDRGAGSVGSRRDGSPVWRYRLGGSDRRNMRAGLRGAARVLGAAGAEEVMATTAVPVRWRPGTESVERFMDRVDEAGYGPHQTGYASFHQMGSARMGSDPGRSVTDAANRVHGTEGLYVMDGSCFPTASGVNPMTAIAAIAHRGAELLADRLA